MAWDTALPEMVKALVSWLPTKDNHKFNIMCDVLGGAILSAYGVFVYKGYEAHLSKDIKYVNEMSDRLGLPLIVFFVFFVLCWLTTFFKKND
ncbi:hypothetical protein [Shewanella oncorhynchi]|uniref:hypothetical protein n=1 Tax=Shewanella oncorhynchi TaxID=2726434 RepID=UPI002E7AE185|nr:hypothetical protein [Shewanella oncorhynchi]WVI91417.1 hypothetical protein VR487_11185 [Shewanella oncorhynchi]